MTGTKTRLAVGLLILLLFLIGGGVLFVRYEIRKSFPETEGTIGVTGIQDPIEISRDEYGVPSVQAASERDMLFALGYCHAQDRLWQMDMQRRAAAGRLSELFGPATVQFDQMFRIVGLRRIAEDVFTHLRRESRNCLEQYAAGVNAYIAAHRGKFPAEFDLLRYDPEPWTALDCISVGRLTAWELNVSWWTDLTYGAIGETVGLERLLDIYPPYPSDVPPTVPSQSFPGVAEGTQRFRRTAEAFRQFAGIPGLATGSNAWAISPSRAVSGRGMLANDTHLYLTLPSQWYEIRMRCPEYGVEGMTIPGVPGVLAGRNDSLAWGITNLMADEADFYVERIDSADSSKYWTEQGWRSVTVRAESIAVRGEDAVCVLVRETRNGPLVTDIDLPVRRSHSPYAASMRWVGREPDDPFLAFSLINRARNWKEFGRGVEAFTVPAQNFVYADVAGNIGYRCGARIPIRPGRSSLLPVPGWDASLAWKGFVPPARLPSMFNPEEGYIATANNKVTDDSYPYRIGDLWEPPSRIVRLREVLGRENERFSVEDFERLQNDTYSHFARDVVPYIFAAFQDSASVQQEDRQLLEYMRNWNYYFAAEDIGTSIFQTFWMKLLFNVYRDEMGEDLFHDFLILVNIPARVTLKLLHEPNSPWFDDVSTPEVENRDDIVRRSFRESGVALRDRFGKETRTWRWGDLHTVTLKHPFGLQKPFDRIFNIGPYQVGGASTALTSFEYDHNEPFEVVIGPTFRQVFVMGVPGESRVVLAGGQSGQLFHPHYSDQTQLWLRGGYRIVRHDGTGISATRLRLEPLR